MTQFRRPGHVDDAERVLADGQVHTLGAVAQRLGVSPSAATRVLRWLEQEERVKRVTGGWQREQG